MYAFVCEESQLGPGYVRGRHSFRTGLEFSGTRYTFLQPTSVSGVRRTTINLGLSF